MARDVGLESDIVDAVIARLIAQIPATFTADNLILCMDWQRPQMTPGAICGLVGPDNGEFVEAMMEGGGQRQAEFAGGIIVGVFTPIRSDKAKRHDQALKDSTRGLYPIWKNVIKALAAWSPGTAGSELTRHPLFPTTRQWTEFDVSGGRHVGFYQRFSVVYDVDLS